MKWLLVIALAACGDNRVPATPDAAPFPDSAPAGACSMTMTGNVDEAARSAALCPRLLPAGTLGDTMIRFVVASQTLATSIGINIDLGAQPTAGAYSSETASVWSALAIESVPVDGACIFTAGAMSIPAGNFQLGLETLDLVTGTVHGQLAVLMYVLPRTTEQGMQTDCGPGTTESLVVAF